MTIDTTDLTWAVALVRSITRDQVEPFRRSDLEIATLLAGTAINTVDSSHYRPHVVAASIIRSDPEWLESESIDNASKTFRSSDEVARGILTAYAWIDSIISGITGGPVARTFQVVF